MPRRVTVPSTDDLFRPTAVPDPVEPAETESVALAAVTPKATRKPEPAVEPKKREPSGRVRHDEKMTVYVTSDELIDLEHARLLLRRHHGIAVDRGRLVRTAVAMALADLEEHGEESPLVRRLREA